MTFPRTPGIAASATAPGIRAKVRSGRRLHDGTFGDNTAGGKAPERDQELTRKSHHHDFTDTAPHRADTLAIQITGAALGW